MISIPFEMILRATLFSCAFGALSGAVYSVFTCLINSCSSACLRRRNRTDKGRIEFDVIRNTVDFFFGLLVGVVYILSSYALLDGSFQIYPIAAFVISYWISLRLLSAVINYIKNKNV